MVHIPKSFTCHDRDNYSKRTVFYRVLNVFKKIFLVSCWKNSGCTVRRSYKPKIYNFHREIIGLGRVS